MREVKGPACLFCGKLRDQPLTLRFALLFQINYREAHRPSRVDDLYRLCIERCESRPQALMTADDLIKALMQRSDVEETFELYGRRDVVGSRAGRELFHKP